MNNNEYAVWQWQNSLSAVLPVVYNILRASESGKWPRNGLIRLYVKMVFVYFISPYINYFIPFKIICPLSINIWNISPFYIRVLFSPSFFPLPFVALFLLYFPSSIIFPFRIILIFPTFFPLVFFFFLFSLVLLIFPFLSISSFPLL